MLTISFPSFLFVSLPLAESHCSLLRQYSPSLRLGAINPCVDLKVDCVLHEACLLWGHSTPDPCSWRWKPMLYFQSRNICYRPSASLVRFSENIEIPSLSAPSQKPSISRHIFHCHTALGSFPVLHLLVPNVRRLQIPMFYFFRQGLFSYTHRWFDIMSAECFFFSSLPLSPSCLQDVCAGSSCSRKLEANDCQAGTRRFWSLSSKSSSTSPWSLHNIYPLLAAPMRRQPDHTAIDVWTRQSRTCHVITRRPSEDLRDRDVFWNSVDRSRIGHGCLLAASLW